MRVELHHTSTLLYSGNLQDFTQPVLIGRSASCQWRTPGEAIRLSSRHARLMREGDHGLILEDLQSTNGSFDSKGAKIERVVLKPGMIFHLGECTLTVSQSAKDVPSTPSVWIALGPYEGQRFPVTPGTHIIGSGEDAAIRIQDPIISTHHAQLAITPDGKATLMDLDSTNGTLLGSKPLAPQTPTPLKPGKLFFIAHHGLKYSPTGKDPAQKRFLAGGIAVGVLALGIILASVIRPAKPDEPGQGTIEPSPDKIEQGNTPPPHQVETAWPPDFAALEKNDQFSPAEVSLLKESWKAYTAAAQAALQTPGKADSTVMAALKKDVSPDAYSSALKPLVSRMEKTIVAAEAAMPRLKALPPTAPALELWAPSSKLENVLSVDTLQGPQVDLSATTPSTEYDAWLGARSIYKELFERSGRLIFTSLPQSTFVPKAKALRERHLALQEVLDWLNDPGFSLSGENRVIAAALQEEVAGRKRLLRSLSEKALAQNGRESLVAAILVEQLSLPNDPTTLGKMKIKEYVDEAFSQMLDKIDSLDAETGDKPDELPRLNKSILQEGLPGDKVVERAWAAAKNP